MTTKPIEDYSDEELQQLAEDSVSVVDRLDEAAKNGGTGAFLGTVKAGGVLRRLKDARDAVRTCRGDLDDAVLMIQSLRGQLSRAEVELAEKTAALRLVDPDAVQRRMEDAQEAGRRKGAAASEAELVSLRAEVARQRSEIDELRANKKKLREALDRAKEGR